MVIHDTVKNRRSRVTSINTWQEQCRRALRRPPRVSTMHVTTAGERQNPTHSRAYPSRASHLGNSWESRASSRGGEVLAYLSHGALALNRRASRGLFAGGLPNSAVKPLKSSSGRVNSRLSSRTGSASRQAASNTRSERFRSRAFAAPIATLSFERHQMPQRSRSRTSTLPLP